MRQNQTENEQDKIELTRLLDLVESYSICEDCGAVCIFSDENSEECVSLCDKLTERGLLDKVAEGVFKIICMHVKEVRYSLPAHPSKAVDVQ